MLFCGSENSAPFHTLEQFRASDSAARKYLICRELFGGPDRDRTDDLFHAMEARSQLRHRPTSGGMQLLYSLRSLPIRQSSIVE
jgi:hypothetical protein